MNLFKLSVLNEFLNNSSPSIVRPACKRVMLWKDSSLFTLDKLFGASLNCSGFSSLFSLNRLKKRRIR
ncbi:hypothetical protein BpHYR1_008056 [Brachionus plicatilis]|uniref:Uncharacterized protein n=1 Tax=Brachionus plicatilis TaxID=10195 RepID=A0A3M7T3D5_BRAPC|nr:hypothetical protein BpHYR1_008056 [Brachionus plicatilis]